MVFGEQIEVSVAYGECVWGGLLQMFGPRPVSAPKQASRHISLLAAAFAVQSDVTVNCHSIESPEPYINTHLMDVCAAAG